MRSARPYLTAAPTNGDTDPRSAGQPHLRRYRSAGLRVRVAAQHVAHLLRAHIAARTPALAPPNAPAANSPHSPRRSGAQETPSPSPHTEAFATTHGCTTAPANRAQPAAGFWSRIRQ